MAELPRGTVTLLFTDIEGSTRLLQKLGRERYLRALADHRRLLRDAFERHGGIEVEMQGDSFHFAFAHARDAVAAAAEGQRALALHRWEDEPIRVRIGLHSGEPTVTDHLYAGLDVHRAARVMSAGHGGQVLLSASTRELVSQDPPDGVSLRDLGEHALKDLDEPERIYQLDVVGLSHDFPPLQTIRAVGREHGLYFRILGPLEVGSDGQALELGGKQRRALLTVLLLNANQVVSVDRLIDDLWGEHPPPTAGHTIQVYVSQLRKLLGPAGEALVTQSPGYMLRLEPGELDLHRFEELLKKGREALDGNDAQSAAETLGQALALWRGPALADFAFEPFAQGAIGRLEELRLVALENRVEADLDLGRHADLVGELEDVVRANPLRERPRAQLILALYRSGRQAEALEAYQETRRALVEELGIDPSPSLQELERAVLNQDPMLDWTPPRVEASAPVEHAAPLPVPERSILLVSRDEHDLDPMLVVAEPLARSRSPHELILARLVSTSSALEKSTTELHVRREQLVERRVPSRAAVFTSSDRSSDIVRLSSQQEVDLLLLDAGSLGADATVPDELRVILEEAPCDVAVVGNTSLDEGPVTAVVVPFGAGAHDWAALELGTWAASAHDLPLRLVGTTADPEAGKRDASRLLASAALAVQQLAGVATESVLVDAGADGVIRVSEGAVLVVVGLSERWRQDGIGDARAAIAAQAKAPVLFVRRGPRPGGLSPREGLTRYTWSLERPG
jgi:DNA-binding SARP family transcriptional activator/class 3 adenylate cyclase